jgi:muramoyltetrapeptide carboxypeptidase
MRRSPSTRTIVAPPLRAGARIGVCAPGGPVREDALERGLAYLRERGFRPVEGRHLRARHAYLAGNDTQRLADLQAFVSDPSIGAIWFARGGYGTGRILADLDLAPLRRAPKALVGYSDLTVLQAACDRALGLCSYYGPLVGELGDPAAFDEGSLWAALSGDAAAGRGLEAGSVARTGRGEGRLVGGCLSLLVGLVGTPYAPRTDGAVLFWEDVNEEPYRIDRMLGQLRLAGVLEGLRGMIVGRLIGCDPEDPEATLPLVDILETHLRGTHYPVVVDFPAGHCPAKVTLPLGRRVRLETAPPRLTVLSAR